MASALVSFFFPEKWSPALQIRTVLLSIQALLSAPNPDDFLDADVAEKWKADERGAKAMGKESHWRKRRCLKAKYPSVSRFQLVSGHKNMHMNLEEIN